MKKQCLLFLVAITCLVGCASKTSPEKPLPVNLQTNILVVSDYYENGQYESDVAILAAEADTFIGEVLESKEFAKPAIVFDIDDTLLDNHLYYKRTGYRFISSAWMQWVDYGRIPALEPIRELFNKYKEEVAIFVVTGRNVFQRAQTLRNLREQGIEGETNIFFKQAWDRELTAKEYKQKIMDQLVNDEGYQIIANFGDQESDFGAKIDGRNFKLPNYLYITQ